MIILNVIEPSILTFSVMGPFISATLPSLGMTSISALNTFPGAFVALAWTQLSPFSGPMLNDKIAAAASSCLRKYFAVPSTFAFEK